ncbi:MAG: nucleotidyltransferase family protein [Gemmataceae bacterium]
MIAAVVPAAGKSARMGRPKLTLPLGNTTVIERVITALRVGGVDRVLVVVGPHVPELAPLATAAGADVYELPHATADMRATVEAGLTWLSDRGPPDAWLLCPADHPTLDAAAVRALIAAWRGEGVLVPTFDGRRGHPVLVAWSLVAGLRAMPAGQGIDAYLRRFAADTLEVPVTNAGVVRDMNTPGDYERLGMT